MKILASELKKTLKVLSPIKTETYQIGENGISAQDQSEALVILESPLSQLGGPFNFSGKKFSQVVARMSGEIDLTVEGNKMTIRSSKAKIELEIQQIKKQNIPETPDKFIKFSEEEFKTALALSASFASTKKSEDFGGKVLIQSLPIGIEDEHPSGYRIVGTDSFVLTVASRDQSVPFEFKYSLNLLAASIVQFLDGDIEIGETISHLVLKAKGATVYAAKSTKVYPPFDRTLAATSPVTISFQTHKWMSCLKTVEPLIDESVDDGNICLHFLDGVVQFKTIGVGSTASDETEYEQTLPDPVFDPKEFEMRIKAERLASFLSKAGEFSTLGVASSKQPYRFESDGIISIILPPAEKR